MDIIVTDDNGNELERYVIETAYLTVPSLKIPQEDIALIGLLSSEPGDKLQYLRLVKKYNLPIEIIIDDDDLDRIVRRDADIASTADTLLIDPSPEFLDAIIERLDAVEYIDEKILTDIARIVTKKDTFPQNLIRKLNIALPMIIDGVLRQQLLLLFKNLEINVYPTLQTSFSSPPTRGYIEQPLLRTPIVDFTDVVQSTEIGTIPTTFLDWQVPIVEYMPKINGDVIFLTFDGKDIVYPFINTQDIASNKFFNDEWITICFDWDKLQGYELPHMNKLRELIYNLSE